MGVRNFRAVVQEKDLDLGQIAHQTGIQKSLLELIMIGAYAPDIDFRVKICQAIGEPFNNELFESEFLAHKAPLG